MITKARLPAGAKFYVGDVDSTVLTADHSGWYLMDGRAISTLPAGAQAGAAELGWVGNIPIVADKALRREGILASTGGNATTTLIRDNLPNDVITGQIPLGGAHGHTFPNTPYMGTVAPNNNTAQNQANIKASNIGISQALVNNEHDHTFIARPVGATNTVINLRTPNRGFNIFVYLGE